MRNLLTFLIMYLPLSLASEAALEKFTVGNNLFTASVYKEVQKTEKGNFLVSPFSAETILALVQLGANDQTGEEIRTSLHLSDNQEETEDAIKSLQTDLCQNNYYKLKTANKIYIKNEFEIRDDFAKIATDAFDSSLENVDFAKNIKAADTMNHWVEKQTEHKIKNLIDPSILNDKIRMILINALYFKGNWMEPFKKYLTSKADFYKTATDVVQVDTMHNTASRKFYESSDLGAKFLEMPFKGDDVAMTIVLPNDKDGLAALEEQLEKVFVVPNYTIKYILTSFPKFKIATQIDFKSILQELGVTKAFKAEEADFSRIAGRKGDLFIDDVVQKTFVDVNEEGVEAAAATFIPFGATSADLTIPKKFEVDHPFIFYIKVKDLVIFAGRVMDPSK